MVWCSSHVKPAKCDCVKLLRVRTDSQRACCEPINFWTVSAHPGIIYYILILSDRVKLFDQQRQGRSPTASGEHVKYFSFNQAVSHCR